MDEFAGNVAAELLRRLVGLYAGKVPSADFEVARACPEVQRGGVVVYTKEGLYAVKTFAAAIVALGLAFATDLDRP